MHITCFNRKTDNLKSFFISLSTEYSFYPIYLGLLFAYYEWKTLGLEMLIKIRK